MGAGRGGAADKVPQTCLSLSALSLSLSLYLVSSSTSTASVRSGRVQ